MHQPTEPRKYQLFPAKDKLSTAGGLRNADAEQSQSTGAGENGTNEKDRSLISLRLKPKDRPIVQRRKASITDLGPMTTVQEVAMDSREYSSLDSSTSKLIRPFFQLQYPAVHLCTSDPLVHPETAGGSMCLEKACCPAYPDHYWMKTLSWLYRRIVTQGPKRIFQERSRPLNTSTLHFLNHDPPHPNNARNPFHPSRSHLSSSPPRHYLVLGGKTPSPVFAQ